MKECPNCKKLFTDDLFYCLYDGAALTPQHDGVDPTAPTEAAYNVGSSDPTQVLPSDPTKVLPDPVPVTQESIKIDLPKPNKQSKLPYVVIGALLAVCAVLAVALIGMNLDRFAPSPDPKAKIGNDAKSSPNQSPAVTTNISQPANAVTTTNSAKAANQPEKPAPVMNPAGRWKGQWSTASGTLLDIVIDFSATSGNGVEGQIKWTMRSTVRPDKMDKIGLSAIEYVRGTYAPETGVVLMSGYKKDDPDDVLVMLDNYRLTVSEDGSRLTGLARNGGKWNGRLKLTR